MMGRHLKRLKKAGLMIRMRMRIYWPRDLIQYQPLNQHHLNHETAPEQ